jgi:uncharacterized membrane protein YeiH
MKPWNSSMLFRRKSRVDSLFTSPSSPIRPRSSWMLFAVSGTQKALAFGLDPLIAALLGMLTGIGGGMLRDVLVREIPTVLREDLYAVAALAGAAIVVAGHLIHLSPGATTIAGATLCFGIRLVAIRRGWSLPTAK